MKILIVGGSQSAVAEVKSNYEKFTDDMQISVESVSSEPGRHACKKPYISCDIGYTPEEKELVKTAIQFNMNDLDDLEQILDNNFLETHITDGLRQRYRDMRAIQLTILEDMKLQVTPYINRKA
ncbi:MAG: hypothetical protein U9Q15_01300 [Patescibacteria group bacterium]|nr:hypothetical protein [Patescibacteria group bacterium]